MREERREEEHNDCSLEPLYGGYIQGGPSKHNKESRFNGIWNGGME